LAKGWTVGDSNLSKGKGFFYLLETVQAGYGAHPPSEVLSGVYSGRGVMLATHIHLVLRLGKTGAIYLLLLFAFMTLGENNLSFTP